MRSIQLIHNYENNFEHKCICIFQTTKGLQTARVWMLACMQTAVAWVLACIQTTISRELSCMRTAIVVFITIQSRTMQIHCMTELTLLLTTQPMAIPRFSMHQGIDLRVVPWCKMQTVSRDFREPIRAYGTTF